MVTIHVGTTSSTLGGEVKRLEDGDPTCAKMYAEGPAEWAKVLNGSPNLKGSYTQQIEVFDGKGTVALNLKRTFRYAIQYALNAKHDCARYRLLIKPDNGTERIESTNADYGFRIDRTGVGRQFSISEFKGPRDDSTRHNGPDGTLSEKFWNIAQLRVVLSAAAVEGIGLPSIFDGNGPRIIAVASTISAGHPLVRIDYATETYAGSLQSKPRTVPCSICVDPSCHWAVRSYTVEKFAGGSDSAVINYFDESSLMPPAHIVKEHRNRDGALIDRTTYDFERPTDLAEGDEAFRLEAYGLVSPGSVSGRSKLVLINAGLLILAGLVFLLLSRLKRGRIPSRPAAA